MYEVERKELERCVKIGNIPREVTMIIKRNDKLDKIDIMKLLVIKLL